MAAKTVRKIPFQIAVRVMSLFTKLRIRFGNTGAIKPRATMSSMTVTKMNGIAAWRFFIAREVSRNVVAVVVSTGGGSASPKTMPSVTPKARIMGGEAAVLCQRVGDNAFHLDYFA